MMKNHKNTVGALAAATAMLTGYAMAGDPTPAPAMAPAATTSDFFQGELHVGYANNYEFRFVDRGDNLVDVGLDLAFDLGNGWGINAGALYAVVNDDWMGRQIAVRKRGFCGTDGIAELDLYAGVGKDFGLVDFEVGYINYSFYNQPANWDMDSQEVYAQVGVDLPWEMRFATTYFYDFDNYSGWYWDFKVTKSFEFTDCLALKLAVGTAMANGHGLQQSRSNRTGTADGYQGWYVGAALPWQVLDTVTLTPYLKYTDADSNLMTSASSSGKDLLIGGVTLSVSF